MGMTTNELRAAETMEAKRKELNARHKASVTPQSKDKVHQLLAHRRPSTHGAEHYQRKEAVLQMLGACACVCVCVCVCMYI
jgi:hypothetical protein